MLTRKRLREVLEYNPDTGVFTRLVGKFRGRRAGFVSGHGHIQISIDNRLYLAHRLAWLYVCGKWPPAGIDHIDNNKQNNAISNLRLATQSQNGANRCAPKTNRSGFKGVHWSNHTRKWRAQITVRGRGQNLGDFETPEEAHLAYVEAAKSSFGEYSRG